MNRLQRKCLVVSAGFHGLLIGVTVFGAAFFVPVEKSTPSIPIKVYYPDDVVDTPTQGGKTPLKVAPPPLPPIKAAPPTIPTIKAAAVAPPVPQPEPTKAPTPIFKEEPLPPAPPKPHPRHNHEKPPPEKKERPKPDNQPDDEPATELTERPVTRSEHQVVIDKGSLTRVTRNSKSTPKPATPDDDQSAEDARADEDYKAAQARARAARAEAISRAGEIARLERSLTGESSSSTKVELPGRDGPNAFSANYRDIVASTYHAAWHHPASLSDKAAAVEVRVTISRDGRVIAKRILKPSGNPDMDRSIERTLDTVKFVEAFPPGTKDQERSFVITFDLEADQ